MMILPESLRRVLAHANFTHPSTEVKRDVYLKKNFFCLFFLGPHPWHMEFPRLGVKSGAVALAYATATAMRDLSGV